MLKPRKPRSACWCINCFIHPFDWIANYLFICSSRLPIHSNNLFICLNGWSNRSNTLWPVRELFIISAFFPFEQFSISGRFAFHGHLYTGSSPNGCSHKWAALLMAAFIKTSFFSTPIQTLYFYIPLSVQLQKRTTFFASRVCLLQRASIVTKVTDINRVSES